MPQIIVALAAPWVGRQAGSWGRRPLLLIGFSALTVRALLFSVTTNPPLLIGIQLLDGMSGSVLGVLTALIVADLTEGTGRFNLAQGFVGTLGGIGASLNTTLFSLVVGNFGGAIEFVGIAGVALSTVLIVWLLMQGNESVGQKAPAALGSDRYGPVLDLANGYGVQIAHFFLKVAHCRAVEMYDSVRRVQGEGSLADAI